MLQLMKASAGSGKTYSLARQYISLLLKSDDRYAYRHILAVTFTNKATDEMKSRILKELHIMASHPSESDYHDDFIPSLFSEAPVVYQKNECFYKAVSQRLEALLNEMYDVNVPFRRTANMDVCEYCDYKMICGR